MITQGSYNICSAWFLDIAISSCLLVLKFIALCFAAFNRPSFPPINLEDLPTVVSNLHDNNDAGFSNEYRVINHYQQK